MFLAFPTHLSGFEQPRPFGQLGRPHAHQAADRHRSGYVQYGVFSRHQCFENRLADLKTRTGFGHRQVLHPEISLSVQAIGNRLPGMNLTEPRHPRIIGVHHRDPIRRKALHQLPLGQRNRLA